MSHGWRVVAHDQRGHGRSEGDRGAIGSTESLLLDLASVIDHVRGDAPSPGQDSGPVGLAPEARHSAQSASWTGSMQSHEPLVLLGHSMGGLVAARFVAEGLSAAPAPWARSADALVLSSPALDAGLSPLQQVLVALASRWAPDRAVGNGLDPHWISRDAAVVQAYVADPLVHDRITGRLARFIADAGPQVVGLAPLWKLPTLLMWGGADRCVAPGGSARFAKAAPPREVRSREWPGLAHEIFNEPEKGEVLAQLAIWLDGRFPPEL